MKIIDLLLNPKQFFRGIYSSKLKKLIKNIRSENLSYCGPPKLENIAEAILLVQKNRAQGIYIEAGVALGGSAILIAKMKPQNTKLELYDVFKMIPPPNENDGEEAHQRYEIISSGKSGGLGGNKYYGYIDDLIETVKCNLKKFGITPESDNVFFKPGLFENTMSINTSVAFAHIDCDWYDSVKVCIDAIAPFLVLGGVVIFDDYSSYSGCKRAVDEWLESDRRYEKLFERRSLGVIRIS